MRYILYIYLFFVFNIIAINGIQAYFIMRHMDARLNGVTQTLASDPQCAWAVKAIDSFFKRGKTHGKEQCE